MFCRFFYVKTTGQKPCYDANLLANHGSLRPFIIGCGVRNRRQRLSSGTGHKILTGLFVFTGGRADFCEAVQNADSCEAVQNVVN